MTQYEVRTVKGHTYKVTAGSAREAKAQVCKLTGKKVSDYWFGAGTMSAKKIKAGKTL